MRISDWSSDVCSSDLRRPAVDLAGGRIPARHHEGELAKPALGRQVLAFDVDDDARERHVQGVLPARITLAARQHRLDRSGVVWGKSVSVRVDLGGRRVLKQKNKVNYQDDNMTE